MTNHQQWRLRPFSLTDFGLSALLSLALVAIWYAGDFHTYHNSDSIMHSWSSIYRWDVFPWELNQHGELFPLILRWVRRPYWNLLAMSGLYSLSFLGGFAVWGSLLLRNTTLTESLTWASLMLVLVLSKDGIFWSASPFVSFGVSFFWAGWFVYWLKAGAKERVAAPRNWLYGLGLFTLSFLTIFTFQGTLVLLLAVVAGTLVRQIHFTHEMRRYQWSVIPSRLIPLVAITAALLAYKFLELSHAGNASFSYHFQLGNLPVAVPRLLANWATHDLNTLVPLGVPLLFVLCRACAPWRRQTLVAPFTLGILAEILIFAGMEWVGINNYGSWYATHLSYLLVLQCVILVASLVHSWLAPQSREARRQLIPKARPLLLIAVLAVSFYLHARFWKVKSPLSSPVAQLEASLGADSPALLQASCDLLVGDYWKVWPAAFALNDYYFRSGTFDARTQTRRTVLALGYRAWAIESLWRPMLNWPALRVCAFSGDEQSVRWALTTYAPDVLLEPLGQVGDVQVFAAPWSGRFGAAEIVDGSPPAISSLAFQFDRPVPGKGWGGVETRVDGTTFQWMAAREATLYVPLAISRDVIVRFHVIGSMSSDILQSLGLRVNGQSIVLDRQQDESGAVTLRGIIPRSILAKDPDTTQLQFRIDRTAKPTVIDPDSVDSRQLGVAFDWLQILPLLLTSQP